MIFQSFNFLLIFLPCTAFLYYLTPNNNWRNIILIIASFIFYAWGHFLWAILLISSATIDFTLAQKIHDLNLKAEQHPEDEDAIDRKRKFFLICSIVFNIGLLVFFKYWDWLVWLAEEGSQANLSILKHGIPLPPAISFYTFESLSYTIDIYRKQFRPTKNFVDYLTFVAFFPKLVAGPIMRAHELLPQLTKFRNRISSRALELALFMIFWGLFKKLVFADNLGHLVDRCRENIAIPGVGLILATVFAFQLYCDFSAYSDIARGTAKLFAITLRRNFLTPYLSANPTEFFQKWNITLSSWIRDYVYIPLGGSHCKAIRNIFNICFTMLLFGLWHGAGIFYAIYGLYAATVIVIYRIIPIDQLLSKFLGRICGRIFGIIFFFCGMTYAMLIFFTKTTKEFLIFSKSFFSIPAISNSNLIALFYGLCLFIFPIFITDILAYRKNREFVDLYPIFKTPLKVMIYFLMFYLTLFFASRGSYDFIYFQF